MNDFKQGSPYQQAANILGGLCYIPQWHQERQKSQQNSDSCEYKSLVGNCKFELRHINGLRQSANDG
jgi:hypothetical protein